MPSTADKNTLSFTLTDLVPLDELQQIQNAFAAASEVATAIADPSGRPIGQPSNPSDLCTLVQQTELGAERCRLSNEARRKLSTEAGRPIYHQCLSCGFLDAGAPIIVDGVHVADWLMGQCDVLRVGEDRIRAYAREIGADETSMVEAYARIPKISLQRFENLLELLWQYARTLSRLGYTNLRLRRDIDERQRIESAQRQSEARYHNLFHNSNDAIFIMNPDGTIIDANRRALEQFGYSLKELQGRPVTDLHPASAQSEVERTFERIRRDGDVRFEIDYKRTSGETFPAEVSASFFDIGDGRAAILSIVRDISERKRAEIRLRSKDREKQALLDAIPDLMFQLERDGTVIAYHGRTDNLYMSPQEFLGRRVGAVLPPKVAEIIMQQIELTLRSHETVVREWDLQKTDGRHYYEGRMVACSNDVVMAILRDITAQRTAAEQERQLRSRLEKAERMESLGILAGGVAHDLNNMLGPLVGYPDLILGKLPADNPARRFIESMKQSATAAADVIQDLLTLARRGRYEMSAVDLNEVVEAYLDSPSFTDLKGARSDITFRAELDSRVAAVNGSFPHLSKLVMNLVVNACEAITEAGEITISTEHRSIDSLLSGYRRIEPGDYVVLRVSDTGKGIDEEDIEKIFEPYYSRKTVGASGTGLGLSVVYGVVKDHHGYYDVFSAPGEGTEFLIYLPSIAAPSIVHTEKREVTGGHESVLVVDDIREQRDMAADILQSLGYDVSTAMNGHDAVDQLSRRSVDLVVLDMIMEEGFDGLDTYRAIARLHPNQRAVIVSGFSSTDRVREMQELGAGAYIRKPYTLDSLGRAVRAELDRAGTPASIE